MSCMLRMGSGGLWLSCCKTRKAWNGKTSWLQQTSRCVTWRVQDAASHVVGCWSLWRHNFLIVSSIVCQVRKCRELYGQSAFTGMRVHASPEYKRACFAWVCLAHSPQQQQDLTCYFALAPFSCRTCLSRMRCTTRWLRTCASAETKHGCSSLAPTCLERHWWSYDEVSWVFVLAMYSLSWLALTVDPVLAHTWEEMCVSSDL